MKKKRILGIGAGLLVLALVLGSIVYVGDYYRADETALEALKGGETVTVEQHRDFVAFLPEEPKAGFVFYPGGKVDHTAYAPLMLEMARRDILCVLVEMPLRLAVLDMDAAAGIPGRFPEVERWYIGGHSLGGSMAASFAASGEEDFQGLVLLGAYSTADLNDTGMTVVSLYGSEDEVLNREKYEQYRENLPEGTLEQVIDGGNHAWFGSYGPQDGDGEGTLSPEEQQTFTAELLAENFFG